MHSLVIGNSELVEFIYFEKTEDLNLKCLADADLCISLLYVEYNKMVI